MAIYAAFSAASVSEGNPIKTGLFACILWVFLYVILFSFVYSPQVMLIGDGLIDILTVIVCLFLSTIGLAAGIQGWMFKDITFLEWAAYLLSVLFLIVPNAILDSVGIFLLAALLLFHYKQMNALSVQKQIQVS